MAGRLLARWLSIAGVAGLCGVLLASAGAAAPQATITVRVDALDFSYELSRRSVPAGSTGVHVMSLAGDVFKLDGRVAT